MEMTTSSSIRVKPCSSFLFPKVFRLYNKTLWYNLNNMALAGFKLEWDAHEYEHKERSSDWFWASGIIAFALAIVSVIFGNIIFGILVLLSTFSLSLYINRPPENTHITVTEQGIIKDRLHYPYSTLASFWIDEEHPHKKIILKSQKIFMPFIIIPLGEDVDTSRLRRTLARYMDEEFHSLPLVERVLEFLGF